MPTTLHALDYLAQPKKHPASGAVVVFGDESFLRRLAVEQLRREVLSGDDAEFSQTTLAGPTIALRDVLDELATVALFGQGRRFVVVEEADDFVTRNRAALEDYVSRPAKNGVLVLEVASFPSNTRLYKAVTAEGLAIEATTPAAGKLLKWLTAWALERYQRKLDSDAAELLLELVGPELGLLDQELAKLNAAEPQGEALSAGAVEKLVGGWRAKTTWEMLDAAVAGDAATALAELDRLLLAGENPVGLLAQISSTLRRFAAATRLIEQAQVTGRRVALRPALEEAGFRSFILGKAETQLRQLGRARARQLYRWLLEADLALKGESQAPPRMILEQLIVRMSKKAAQQADPATQSRER